MAIHLPTNAETTLYNRQAAASATLPFVVPSGVSDGDHLLILAAWGDNDQTWATPSTTAGCGAWNLFFQVQDSGGDDCSIGAWWCVVNTAASAAGQTVNLVAGGSEEHNGVMLVVQGAHADFVEVAWAAGSHFASRLNSNAPTPQPITTVNDGAVVISMVGNVSDAGHLDASVGLWVVYGPSGYTVASAATAVDQNTAAAAPGRTQFGAGAGDTQFSWAHKTIATAGTQILGVWGGFKNTRDLKCATFAIKPDTAAASATQYAYRIYADGTEAGSVAHGDLNRGKALADDTVYLVRFGVSAAGDLTVTPKLQYRRRLSYTGGYGSWTDVNASSSYVRSAASGNIADNAVTTERLAGAKTFTAGRYDEVDGAITTGVVLSATTETEFLFAIKVRSAELNWMNNVELRLVNAADGVAYGTYLIYPYVSLQGSVEEDFEVAPDATTLTTSNTIFDYISLGGGFASDDARAAHGTYSGLANGSTSGNARVYGSGSLLCPELFARAYIYVPSTPTVNANVLVIKGGAGSDDIGNLVWRTTGVLSLLEADSTLTDLSGTPSTGQWIRVELRWVRENSIAGTGILEAKFWNTPDSSGTADGTATITGAETDPDPRYLQLEWANSDTWNYDDLVVSNIDWIGPVAIPIIEQKAFRFRDDSVALNTDTWTYALNTDLTAIAVDSDVTLRLRVLLQNDGTLAMPSTGDYQLQYQVNTPGLRDVSEATATAATSISIPRPASLRVGDLMVAEINKSGIEDWTSASATWTEENTVGANGQRFSLLWRVADSADVAASTFDWGWASSANAQGVIAAFNVESATPTFEGGSSNSVRTDDTTPASGTYSATVGNLLLGSAVSVQGVAAGGLGMVTAGLELLGNPDTGTGTTDVGGLLAWKVADGTESVFEVNNAQAGTDSYVHYWEFSFAGFGGWDGTYTAIGAGTGVDTALSSNYANGDATTQLLGAGSFATGDGVEGSSDAVDRAIAATYETEHEWAIQLTAAELLDADVIDFRVVWRQVAEAWNAPDTVTQTPSITVTKGGNDKSGSGAITSTAGLTATGTKAVSGSATITATVNVTATGTALEFHSGSAAIAASHTITATGDAVEFHSGSASIIATHTATAAGDAAEFHSGSGTISSSSSVTASGVKAAEGDASVTSTSNVTASGVAVEFHAGSGSISSTVAVDAVGVSARAGTATVTSVGVLTATGVKSDTDDRSGSGAIASTATVTATGTAWEGHSGSASIASTATVTATGVKAAQGATSIASTATLTATGVRDDGTNDKSGSGAITSTAGVTATGAKAISGTATIASTTNITATGVAVEFHSGSGSVSSTSSVTASGVKDAEGAASIAATASVTATGVKAEGSDDRSGSGSIASTATLTATGTSARFGTASVASTGTITATGVKDDSGNDKFGFGAITSTATITATGVAFFAAGAGDITAASTITATGTKNATGTATITAVVSVTATGTKATGGVGAIGATVTLVTSAYMWIILEAGIGRGLTDDGQAPGHTDDGGEPGITDDRTQPGQTNALHSIGTTS